MKKLLPILLVAVIGCSAPKQDKYTINGTVTGEVPEVAYLQIYEDGAMKNLDTAKVENGKFIFEGKVDYPDNYFVLLGDKNKRISFFAENSKINISADVDSLDKAEVRGSGVHNEYLTYSKSKKEFDEKLNQIYAEYRAAADSMKNAIGEKYDSVDNLKGIHIKNFVKSHGSSVLSPYIINRELLYKLDLAELEELTDSISVELKDYKHTKTLFERIEKLRSLQPGKPAPEFTQNDVDGNPVNLSDYRGKYLLIDFWASWCSPCRAANPAVVEIFKKYSDKNFDILGISLDSKQEDWLQAVKDDQLTWKHVSTLEGWKNPVAKLYGVMSIPHAILINPEGVIVKRGLHPEELEKMLPDLINGVSK